MHPFPSALRRSAYLLGASLLFTSSVLASEKDELASTQRLLDQVQASLERARVAAAQSDPADHARYHFDYQRITADLNMIISGIDTYLAPSRAQHGEAGAIAGIKRGEPENYIWQRLDERKCRIGLGDASLITHSQRWSLRRSQSQSKGNA